MSSEAVDITLPGARPTLGHQHLINQIIDEIEDVFCGIGYTVEKGPQVETSYYYFTALNALMDHPSRSARDTFYVADNAPRHGARMAGQPESDGPSLQAEARGAALAEAARRLRQRGRPGGDRVGAAAGRALHGPARPEGERRGADGTGMHVKADAGRVQHGRDLL